MVDRVYLLLALAFLVFAGYLFAQPHQPSRPWHPAIAPGVHATRYQGAH